MANNLDLEEQEQLDQLKHFWNTWGTLISATLVLIFGALAAWNGYQYWQNRQASQAAALFGAIEAATKLGERPRIEQAFLDIKIKYPRTIQAAQAGFLVAKTEYEKGHFDSAKAALLWIGDNAIDEGHKATASLRLTSILIQQEAYDEALKHLSIAFPTEFQAAVADRRGDVKFLQGKKQDAITEYSRAHSGLVESIDYRQLVEFKLNALGVTIPLLATSGTKNTVGATQ